MMCCFGIFPCDLVGRTRLALAPGRGICKKMATWKISSDHEFGIAPSDAAGQWPLMV
jgi:hypothetical protein